MKKALSTAILAIAITMAPTTSKAVVYLGLAIDRSGSISSSDFATQISAYQTALTSTIPTDGSVGIGLWSFGASVIEHYSTNLIASAADLTNLVSSVAAITQVNAGATALGPAINTAAASILAAGGAGDTFVIDVSTDGFGNSGTNQVTAATNAIAAGVDNINGLGIGAGANLNFVMGPNSFATQIATFGELEKALTDKLKRETAPGGGTTGVPEPSFAIPAMLVGLMAYRRRRRA